MTDKIVSHPKMVAASSEAWGWLYSIPKAFGFEAATQTQI